MNAIRSVVSFLNGYKTYIVGAAGILYGVGIGNGWWQHSADIDLILGSTGAITLRAAIAKLCALISAASQQGPVKINIGPGGKLTASPTVLIAACMLIGGNLTYAGVDAPFSGPALADSKSISEVAATPTPPPTPSPGPAWYQRVFSELQSAQTVGQLEAFAYPEYGRALNHKVGGSIDLLHPINQYAFVGVGLTELDGGFFAAALGVTLKTSFDIGKFRATPFAEVAVETPFAGSNGNILNPGALTAVGAFVRLWKNDADTIELGTLIIAKWYSQYNLPDQAPTTLGFGGGFRVSF